jgi:hypothetical protein
LISPDVNSDQALTFVAPGLPPSHPYVVASLGRGSWAVADAGANAILKVSATGQVPTDVEVGPLGQPWVSTLPGGPEDPSLGARGSASLPRDTRGPAVVSTS